jgi:hypothetical protein
MYIIEQYFIGLFIKPSSQTCEQYVVLWFHYMIEIAQFLHNLIGVTAKVVVLHLLKHHYKVSEHTQKINTYIFIYHLLSTIHVQPPPLSFTSSGTIVFDISLNSPSACTLTHYPLGYLVLFLPIGIWKYLLFSLLILIFLLSYFGSSLVH